MKKDVQLWGINGVFIGNEARIIWFLPAVGDSAKRKIAVARTHDWTLDSDKSCNWLRVEEAHENVTQLDHPIGCPRIHEGDIVAVTGPEFEKSLRLLGINDQGLRGRCQLTSDFCVNGMPHGTYIGMIRRIAAASVARFDEEMTKTKGEQISQEAENALLLIEGNAAVSARKRYPRLLYAMICKGEKYSEQYYRVLIQASYDLHRSLSALDRMVGDLYRSYATIPTQETS